MADRVETRRERANAEVEFGRIVAFSDGVFSIAITLLVLGLTVPSHGQDFGDALLDERHSLFAYALSFAVLGRFWVAHHGFFGGLASFDGRLIGLNLLYLAWIALVPFTSQLLGDYGSEPLAIIVYAASLGGVMMTFGGKIVYAYRRGLLRAEYREIARNKVAPGTFAAGAIFLLSMPIALISPTAAELSWLLLFTGDRLGELISRPLMDPR
jgi:uncharacterized membrane protein